MTENNNMKYTLNQMLKKLNDLDTSMLMMVFQLVELNRLLKKLNYISGTDAGISPEEIKDEIDFLVKYVECIRGKSTVCPIRGLVKKFGRHIGQDETEKVLDEKYKNK